MAGLRRLLAGRDWFHDLSRTTDDRVLAAVAKLLSAGELPAGMEWKGRISAPRNGEPAAPAPSAPQPQSRHEEPEEDTFGGDHDGAGQAGALIGAAQSGVPFCEECARAAAAAGGGAR